MSLALYQAPRLVPAAIEKAPAKWKVAVENTVQAAALCGTYVPIQRLAEFQGVDHDQRDKFIDVLDELFASDGLLEDFGYTHPGFPGELIYSFANSVISRALRNSVRSADREELPTQILQFLDERFRAGPVVRPVSTGIWLQMPTSPNCQTSCAASWSGSWELRMLKR